MNPIDSLIIFGNNIYPFRIHWEMLPFSISCLIFGGIVWLITKRMK